MSRLKLWYYDAMADDHIIGSGLTEQELQIASFWVRNRSLLRQILFGSLIGLNVIFWLFVLWGLLDWLAISYPYESRIPARIANNQIAVGGLQASAPKSIQPSQVYVFETTGNRSDMLVELSNANTQWYASFDYKFNIGGKETPVRHGFILPNSQRYLTELGFEGASGRSASLIVENLHWMRVDPAWVNRDYATFANERLNFSFNDIKYARDLIVGTQTIGQSSFDFVNNSAYGYWDIDLTVVLYRGTAPVGVTTITQREIKPGQTTPVSINWYDNLPGITRTEVRASVNILDPQAYLSSERF